MATYKEIFLLIDKVTAPLKTIQKNTEKVTQATEKLTKRYSGLQKGLRNAEAGLIHFDRKLRDMTSQLDKFGKRTEHITKLGSKIKSIGNSLTIGVTLPVVAMGGAMVKAAADMESMQTQLNTMLGSAEKGGKMFTQIQKMAAKTPFDASDLMEVTNVMLGFGQAEEKVLPLMQQLGDISGGNKDKFKSLALAFSQASSVGKLQGQDWLQMVNAGFNPLEAMSKRTGKSIAQLKDDMSKGKISIQMVEQAMKDVTSEGGRFFNMMEKQSQTGLGQWSTFMGQINLLLASFGKIILPIAIKGMQKLSNVLEKLNNLTPGTKKLIIIFAAVAAAIGPLLSGLGSLVMSIGAINTALIFLEANPIVLIIMGIVAAIAALTVGVIYCYNKFEGFRKMMQAIGAVIQLVGAIIKLVFVAYFQYSINVIQNVISWFGSLQEVISSLPAPIQNLGKVLFGALFAPLKAIWDIIQLVISGLEKVGGFRGLGDRLKTYADTARGHIENTTNNITNNNNSGNTTTNNNVTHNHFGGGWLNWRQAQYSTDNT